MQAMWNAVGLKSSAGPTLFRKAAVTSLHLRYPSEKTGLASEMNHTEAVAARNYFTIDREETGNKISKDLGSVLLVA